MSILTDLREAFPNCWFKDAKDFDGGTAIVWSGEGSYIGDLPAFDHYAANGNYAMGVLVAIDAFVDERGYWWSCEEPGTYLLYPL